jgi:hypothetical protein
MAPIPQPEECLIDGCDRDASSPAIVRLSRRPNTRRRATACGRSGSVPSLSTLLPCCPWATAIQGPRSSPARSAAPNRFAADPVVIMIQMLGVGSQHRESALISDGTALIKRWTGGDTGALIRIGWIAPRPRWRGFSRRSHRSQRQHPALGREGGQCGCRVADAWCVFGASQRLSGRVDRRQRRQGPSRWHRGRRAWHDLSQELRNRFREPVSKPRSTIDAGVPHRRVWTSAVTGGGMTCARSPGWRC